MTEKEINEASERGTKMAQPCRAPSDGSALYWSTDFPKLAGLYWVRYHGQEREIVALKGESGNLKMDFYGMPTALHNLPSDWGWQWSGPIPEPKEPNAALCHPAEDAGGAHGKQPKNL